MVRPIHPKAYREKVGPEGFAKAPIGAGPYKIVKNDQGKEVVYEKLRRLLEGLAQGSRRSRTCMSASCPTSRPR